jgi:MerR family redox-sensitive transcriptional activator SoxR
LTHCSLYNAGDEAAGLGSGPRYLLGDEPQDKPG